MAGVRLSLFSAAVIPLGDTGARKEHQPGARWTPTNRHMVGLTKKALERSVSPPQLVREEGGPHAPEVLPVFQQATVGGDLSLQLDLDIQQGLVLLGLALPLSPGLGQL